MPVWVNNYEIRSTTGGSMRTNIKTSVSERFKLLKADGKVNKKLSPLDSHIIRYRTRKFDYEDGDAGNTTYGGYYL